jgi:4-hydroxybenzoate polyprenyltransferase
MKKGMALLDRFFLLRPTLFFPIWIYFLAGLAGGARFRHGSPDFIHPIAPVWILAALTLLGGAVYILNQIQDRETDRLNGKLFLIANGVVDERQAFIQAAALAAVALGAAFWIDLLLGFGFLTLFLITGVLYNFPPTSWKNIPVPGLAVNACGMMLVYDMGWVSGGGDQAFPVQALAYGLGTAAVYLNTTLPDIKGDARTGKITFGVRYGIRNTAVWALIFEAACAVMALATDEWMLLLPSAAVLPLFAAAAASGKLPDSLRATKFSVLALAVSVCVRFPLTLAPVAAVFFLSRWYYRNRFGFDYPNFKAS